jgi:competence protein ComEC
MWRIGAGATAGCCSILLLPAAPSVAVLACAALFIGLLAAWRRHWWALAFVMAACWCALQLHWALAARLDPALEGEVLQLRGTVVNVPQGTRQALRFRLAPDRDQTPGGHAMPARVELVWYDAPFDVVAAERLEVEVKLRRPRGFANPGGRDNEARMLREHVGASGYVRRGKSLGRAPDAALRSPVLLVRAAVAERIDGALAGRPSAGIVAGLAVGLQDALSREQWLTLSRSGTSHLMAISGLHIGMVAAVVAWCAARLQRWRQRAGSLVPQRDVAVAAGACAAFAYSLLAGWSVPTQRTMVMIGLGALALILRRRTGVADGVGACVLAVLALDPLAPLAPGFWLSFGAVAAILHAATGYVRPVPLWRSYLHVQAIVTLGLVPMLAGSFGALSLVSVLVNLYAIPLYTLLVVPATLVSSALALAWPAAGSILLRGTGALVEATWPLIEVPTRWPLATWPVAGLDGIAWIALCAGAVAALSPLPRLGRAAGVGLVVAACAWRPAPVAAGTARLTVLDVGQGLAVVVETRHHALVYDAGPSFRSGSDTGQIVVVPYLHHRGLRSLDLLAVSHDDDDHKGGAASVLALLRVARFVAGPGVDFASFARWAGGAATARCESGQSWHWDGVRFDWLHPGAQRYERDNDGSCVLRVQAGDRSALITGDVERQGEADLLASGALSRVDVMIVPHHGSRTSSTHDFVVATRPAWVVYAAGYRNRWNFPAQPVVERWEDAGARGLVTGHSGAVTFELGTGRPVEPVAWRLQHRRPWRDP